MFEKLLPKIDLTSHPDYDRIYGTLTDDQATDEDRRRATSEYNVLFAEALAELKARTIKRIKAAGLLVGAVVIIGGVILFAAGASESSEEDEEDEKEEENEDNQED